MSVPGLKPKTPAGAGPVSRNAFHHRNFVLFWTGRLCATFAIQIVSVAVGWQVYDLTRNPFDLGLVGLVQFLPALLLVLVTGPAADRFSRRAIMAVCLVVEAMAALALLLLTLRGLTSVAPVFVALTAFGIARAFFAPASSSIVPSLVPEPALAHAITWASSAWQFASIVGPVAGGLLYGLSPEIAYGAAVALLAFAGVMIALIRAPQPRRAMDASWATLVAGFAYLSRERVVLGAVTLDLFAVLLGGAVALMPAVARDVLEVGPWGLGLLRAAPGIGAIAVAALLSFVPIRDRAGHIMFVCVALFGLATVVFGLSATPWLSIAALLVMGGADMVSVTVRETLLQLWTPDDVRGRVNAVNMMFVGASNELGEFRAGSMAAVIGVMPAIVVGGIGTVAVAGLWAWWFPQLRTARSLERRDS